MLQGGGGWKWGLQETNAQSLNTGVEGWSSAGEELSWKGAAQFATVTEPRSGEHSKNP